MKCCLDNAALFIERSIWLHNFLADYKKFTKDHDIDVDAIIETYIFEQGLDDNTMVPIVVGNQLSRGTERLTLHGINYRTLGLQLRDNLKNDLQDYGQHDNYSHIVRTE